MSKIIVQTIFKTAPAANFTIFSNDFISSDMPAVPQKILSYLLSKPADWQLRRDDLRKQLGLTHHAIKKALKWLQIAGYVYYKRYFGGYTKWFIFDKPQTAQQTKTAASPAISIPVEKTHVLNQPVLLITDEQKETTTTPIPITTPPIPESIVVVSYEEEVKPDMVGNEEKAELIYPVQLTDTQKKAARHVIKKVKQPELQQPVLFALAYAITNGKITSSVPAYLNGIVKNANNGIFTPIQVAGETKQIKPKESYWQGHKPPEKVDNDSYFQELINKFGSKGGLKSSGTETYVSVQSKLQYFISV